MVLHSLPWNSFITLPPARVSSIAALFILQCPGIWPVQSSFHSFDALPSPLFSYGTTHQSSAKALDKAVAKHWKAGEYLSQQALTKLSAKLQQKGLAPISNWPNYRKAYLERCARARAAKDKRGKTQDARAVVKLFLKDRLGAAAKAKPGQLTKGHYETFLQQKLLVPLKVSGDVDRVARWTDRFGRHLNKRVTMSTLFSLAQLHPVEPDVPQWNYIADALLGKVLYTQARLRGTEIPQWWQDHGLAHNGGADGIARSLDREHFRQT
ncbi:unnamed protein product, partial [Durusdinium trenchii]